MIKNRVTLTIAALCLVSLTGIVFLLDKISVNQSSSLEQMLSKEDIAQINTYRTLFDVESEPVIVAIQSPSEISTARISEIETSLLSISAVSNSLSSVSVGKFGADGAQIFSANDNTELIVLMISLESQQLTAAKGLSLEIEQVIAAQLGAGESSVISGMPQIRTASWEISNSDIKVILPLLVVITLVVTQLFFKSHIALGLSLLLTALTTCICLGLQLIVRAEINALIILVVPVIWAIATLDAFHLYSRTAIRARQNHPHPATAAGRELFIPCLLTTATTAGCFMTLTFLDTSPLIVSFGVWGTVGAVVAFILTFTLGEKILSMQVIKSIPPRWPSILAFNITRLAQTNRKATIVIWGALVLCSVLLASHIKVSTSFPQVFTSGHSIAADINRLKALTDSDLNAIDVIIESSDLHGESEERLASAALLTNNYLNTIDETRLVLPVGVMDQVFVAQKFRQWQADRATRQALTADDFRGLGNWVNTDHHAVRLQLHLADTSYKRKEEIVDWLVHFDETMLGHHTLILSGSGYFYYLTEKRGVASLLSSGLLSLLIIGTTLLWVTRDKLPALIAVCASVIPAAILAGCMAILDMPWSIAMLPMPAVLLGLMTDDTIHMLWSSRRSRRSHNGSLRHNAILAGPALLATTVVLAGAVGALIFSGIQTNQYLGVLIPLGLVLALLCNLTLLPALNSLLHKSTLAKN